MAERGLFLNHVNTPAGPRAQAEDAPLTQPERENVEQDFEDYIGARMAELADKEWSPEEKVRHATFQYAYERHRAQRYHEMGQNGFTRWMQQQVYSRGAIGATTERAVNWTREIGTGVAVGTAAKVGAAAVIAPQIGHFLNITGGPAAWVTGAIAGGVAGGVMGYRRAGERYVTKNLNAEKLSEEFQPETLLNQWEAWAVSQHDEKMNFQSGDPLYNPADEPEAEGRVSAGRELPGDYYDRVADALAHLDEIADSGMLRGNWQHKAGLADQRAKLAAILETRTFFEEQAKRNEESAPNYMGLPPANDVNIGQLSHLWVDLQELRTKESLNERFNTGCSERAREFVQNQRQAARAASRKGAMMGALSGALLGGVFSHFLGGKTTTITTPEHEVGVPQGYGGGEADSIEALSNALSNKEFTSLSHLLENQSELARLGNADPAGMQLINDALRSHHLPPVEHYTLPSGDNALLDMINKANAANLPPTEMQSAVYNFMSHYNHAAGGLSLEQWHDHLAQMPPEDIANVNTFDAARDLYLDRLRLLGQLQTVPQTISETYTPAPATELSYDTIMGQGVIPALVGHAVGDAVGQFGTRTENFRGTVKPIELTPEYAQSFGKQLPEEGQVWELRHGSVNYNLNNLFRDVNGKVPAQTIEFRINRVDGRYADVEVINAPADYAPMRKTFKLETQELLEEKAFQLNETPARREAAETKAREAADRAKEAADAATRATKAAEIAEWERDLPGTEQDHSLVYRVTRGGKPPTTTIRITNTSTESTTSWPITIINPNEFNVIDAVNTHTAGGTGDYTLPTRLVITRVDGAAKRVEARLKELA